LYEFNVIIGPEKYRHIREINQFIDLSDFKSVFITANNYVPFKHNVNYSNSQINIILPDLIVKPFVRKPYGPVSFINLKNLDKMLTGDLINCVELYSFVSSKCVKIAKQKKIKICLSSWETISSNPLFYFPPYSFNVNNVKNSTDMFIVPTHKAALCLENIKIDKEKIKVIKPGIDTLKFKPSKHYHDKFRILFVGRLDSEKGINILLESFLKLYDKIKEVELWFCGPTRSGKKLFDYLNYLSSKYPIKIFGDVPNDKLSSIYNQCDVLCLPSIDRTKWGFKIWEEQFGWTLVEAMSCGLPIIASDCGAIQEVIGSHNFLVNQNSSKMLNDAFTKLVENPNLLKEIGKMNRLRALQFYDINKQRVKLNDAMINLIES